MKTTLYAKDAKKKIRVWSISYDETTITIATGLLGGEEIITTEDVHFGLASRTKQEQILSRVNSRINKQKDKGYVESLEDAQNDVRTNQLGYLRAAKCSRWDQRYKNIPYDVTHVQHKLNGYHCSIINDDGKYVAYSSNGKIIDSVDHILREINIPKGRALEGELYIHGMPLQDIGSLVRKLQPNSEKLHFFAYDTPITGTYSRRLNELQKYDLGTHATALATHTVYGKFEIEPILAESIKDGFEGLVVRLDGYEYEAGIRSQGVIKVKSMHFGKFKIDDEFLIVDIIPSKDMWAIFVCETHHGATFKVSCFGTMEFKAQVYKDREKYLLKHLRVEFSEYTKDKKPFHPVAICFREKFDE